MGVVCPIAPDQDPASSIDQHENGNKGGSPLPPPPRLMDEKPRALQADLCTCR